MSQLTVPTANARWRKGGIQCTLLGRQHAFSRGLSVTMEGIPSKCGTRFMKGNVSPFPSWCRVGMRYRCSTSGKSNTIGNIPIHIARIRKVQSSFRHEHASTCCLRYNATLFSIPRDTAELYRQIVNHERIKSNSVRRSLEAHPIVRVRAT